MEKVNNPWLKVLAIIIWICILMWGVNQCRDKTLMYSVNNAQKDTIKCWKNEAGYWQSEKRAVETDLSTVKEFFEKELEAVRKDLDVKTNHIVSLTKLIEHSQGTVQLTPKGNLYWHQDEWNTFSLDTNYQLTYKLIDSINIAAHYMRHSWFKKKQIHVSAVSYNPNTVITGLDHLEITNKPSRFAISMQAGYGASKNGLNPYLGIGLSYDIFRF